MASAGQAQAHSSHPMHFSRPSGQRFSWCRPWYLGAVGFFSSGYWTVSTFRNICRNVTPNPLIELSTGDLVPCAAGRLSGSSRNGSREDADPVVVRQVQGRDGECPGRSVGVGLGGLDLGGLLGPA